VKTEDIGFIVWNQFYPVIDSIRVIGDDLGNTMERSIKNLNHLPHRLNLTGKVIRIK